MLQTKTIILYLLNKSFRWLRSRCWAFGDSIWKPEIKTLTLNFFVNRTSCTWSLRLIQCGNGILASFFGLSFDIWVDNGFVSRRTTCLYARHSTQSTNRRFFVHLFAASTLTTASKVRPTTSSTTTTSKSTSTTTPINSARRRRKSSSRAVFWREKDEKCF